MEQNGRTHNVRQFISYDSPQVGANFPLSLQFWAQSFSAFNTSILNVAELAGVRSFNSESSKQMLKFHLTGVKSVNGRNVIEPISNHTNFYNEIEGLNNNLGYPLNCQNIAISNGNKQGVGFINSGVANAGIAFAYDFDVDNVTVLTGFVRDLPTAPTPSNPAALYAQHSPLGRDGFNLVPISPEQDYDNAPGGFINWYSEIVTEMVNQGFIASVRPNQENVTFIPTHSALGLKDPDLFRNLTTWQDHELEIPFDGYYSPQLANQFHVALPTITANWLHLQITSPELWQINNVARSFNFGVNTNDFIFNNVNVSNGGLLGVNTNRRTDAYEFNSSSATQQSFPSSTGFDNWFPVQTSSKKPVTITIDNNGSLEMGSTQTNGLLKIKNGSTLHLKSGSRLSQMFNSRIEIKSGGKMIIDGGANINLADNNCSIIIEDGGELVINGQFNFSGNGHFRFEQGNTFTLKSSLLLRGSARNNPIIRIAQGATVRVSNPVELRVENGTIVRESGGSGVQRHIWLRNGATFKANNVLFDDQSGWSNQAAFIEVDDPIDTDNDPNDVDYEFINCKFQGNRTSLSLNMPNASSDPFDWRNVNVEFKTCEFIGGKAIYADRSYITLFDNCTLTDAIIEMNRTYWLNIRNTRIRSTFGTTGTAIKATHVGHFWFRENSLIDNFGTGIDASSGLNWNIIMTDGSTIQQCATGIHLNGSQYNATVDLGILHMDCARMIQNETAIRGRDIIFSAYARNPNFNTFTQSQNNPTGRYIESVFEKRNETDLWFHGNFWDNTTPPATSVNPVWSFLQKTIPQTPGEPWNGTFHLEDTRTGDPNNTSFTNCGGVTLRDAPNDPLSKKTIVKVDGVYRNVKIQQDAGLNRLRQNQLKNALELLTPVAEISSNIRDTASATVKHFVDVARAMTLKLGVDIRSTSNKGWLPETLVEMPKEIAENQLIISPNPANTTVQIDLSKGNYKLNVSNTIGQSIFEKYTEGSLSVDVSTWTNGIYLFEITDKATNKRQRSKIVVQH